MRSPIRRHPLAAIEAAIFLFRPRLMIAPSLKIGLGAAWQVALPGGGKGVAGLVERVRRAAELPAAAWIKSAIPLPVRSSVRAEGAGDRADADVAIVDKPAIGAVRIAAADRLWHRCAGTRRASA